MNTKQLKKELNEIPISKDLDMADIISLISYTEMKKIAEDIKQDME